RTSCASPAHPLADLIARKLRIPAERASPPPLRPGCSGLRERLALLHASPATVGPTRGVVVAEALEVPLQGQIALRRPLEVAGQLLADRSVELLQPELRVVQFGPAQGDVGDLALGEADFLESGIAEDGPPEVRPRQDGTAQVGLRQVGLPEVRLPEDASPETRPGELRGAQASLFEFGILQISPPQIRVPQVGPP